MNNIELLKTGFIDEDVKNINLVEEIEKLKKEKNAVILAHYYVDGKIQDIADYVGDSLALAQNAKKIKNDIIVFAGVHFMAETAKIICPDSKVLLPDLNAGCSLADSCPPEEFAEFIKKYPDHTVISYINTTAKIKALTDIVCTSSNALQIVESLPINEKIIFAPDRNLGNYIKKQTNRENFIIWDGACHVHDEFSLERILALKKEHPDAKIIAHPECQKPILLISDFIGSTSALLKYSYQNKDKKFIVATESGIIHQMRKKSPDKTFIPAPPNDSTCGCNDCNYMKLMSMKKLYLSLKHEQPEIILDETLMKQAKGSIDRMLEISEKLGL